MQLAKKITAASDEGSGVFDFSKKPKSQTTLNNVKGKSINQLIVNSVFTAINLRGSCADK